MYTNIIQFIGFETTFLLHILFFLRFCQKLQSYPLNENITRNETWQTIHLNTRYNVKWPNALFLLFIQSNSEISNGQFNSYLKLMGICWYVAFLTSNMKLLYMCFFSKQMRDRRGHNRIVVGFRTTYAINFYQHYRCEFESRSGEVYSIQHYVIKFVSDVRQIIGFLLTEPVSSINKTDRHDITELVLKVAFNDITPPP